MWVVVFKSPVMSQRDAVRVIFAVARVDVTVGIPPGGRFAFIVSRGFVFVPRRRQAPRGPQVPQGQEEACGVFRVVGQSLYIV